MTDGTSWFGFDDLFWLTLLVLFGSALLAALLRLIQKDRCLRLLNDFHVTLIAKPGTPEWGDLLVTGSGVELQFDTPYTNRHGLVKATHLVGEAELQDCLAMVRTVHALTDTERTRRDRQIKSTFNPNLLSTTLRRMTNLRDMVSDSIAKSLTLVLGNVGGALGSAVSSQKGEVSELGKTLAGTLTSAYEPLLERHIGKPVIVECQNAAGAATATSEFSGYLVDYTDKYIAVFNDQQGAQKEYCTQVKNGKIEALEINTDKQRASFSNQGPGLVILKKLTSLADDQVVHLDIALLPGCAVEIVLPNVRCEVDVEQTFGCDLVCPRTRAAVRYGSSRVSSGLNVKSPHGAAPVEPNAGADLHTD